MEDIIGDFFDQIDDLLVFPNDEKDEFILTNSHQEQQQKLLPFNTDHNEFLPQNPQHNFDQGSTSFDIIPLEWMSQFLEDSDTIPIIEQNPIVSVVKATNSTNPNTENSSIKTLLSPSSTTSSSCSSTSSSSSQFSNLANDDRAMMSAVPARIRSKRPRSAAAVVSSRPRIRVSVSAPTATNFVAVPVATNEDKDKKRKKMSSEEEEESDDKNHVRKCLHCEITKTPQWRAGPMGPKTLCNACGVRYKSGRLFPEYRPAASPTFVASVHSNSHKKVVEMRNRAVDKARCELLDYVRMQRVVD